MRGVLKPGGPSGLFISHFCAFLPGDQCHPVWLFGQMVYVNLASQMMSVSRVSQQCVAGFFFSLVISM